MGFLATFGKVVAKNGAFGNNTIFLQQLFSISGGTFPVFPPGGAYDIYTQGQNTGSTRHLLKNSFRASWKNLEYNFDGNMFVQEIDFRFEGIMWKFIFCWYLQWIRWKKMSYWSHKQNLLFSIENILGRFWHPSAFR